MQLKFLNESFNEGENITVRRGVKWDGVKGIIPINDNLSAKILYTQAFRFLDLSAFDLSKEHDASCREYNGLWEEMKRLYVGFCEREIVTVVHFEVMPNSDQGVKECDTSKS